VLESRKVYLFGYSGHSYVLIESFINAGYTVAGYFDYQEVACNPYQIPYLGSEDHVDVKSIVKNDFVFPSIGDNIIRAKLVSFFERQNLNQCVLIDPSANVSPTARILESTYIGKNAVINAKSYIGKGVIVNTSAIIEHECSINDFCHIAPSSVLCGNVSLGEFTFVGANSTVKNNISISACVILGAGSVVVKPVNSNGVWIGNPLKKIK